MSLLIFFYQINSMSDIASRKFFNSLIASIFVFLLNQPLVLADSCTGNCIDGQGTLITKEGDKYTGEFKHGEPDGKGTAISAKGDRYSGEFKNGMADGNGTAIYSSGDKYEGEWKNDKFDGQGTLTSATGDKYTGKFKNGYPVK